MCEPDHLPTVRALDALWAEVTSKPLWSKPNFWRYLRLRRTMRLKLLDPNRVQILAPAGKINDCSTCTDICCIGPSSTVLLRLKDIATLVDLGRDDLMTRDKPRFSEDEQDARPALQRHVASDAWRIFPVLRQTGMGACAALSLGGQCSLYPNWPLSCARFPYALHADDGEIFYSPRCDSYWVRPDATPRVRAMAVAAVDSYNQRIKDAVLLEYARPQLDQLGLTRFLSTNR
jgi:Fe-S-cluster containining protein